MADQTFRDLTKDAQVELTSVNGTSIKNATQDTVDIDALIDDWMHFRNLPYVSTIFVALATAVNHLLDFFIDFHFSNLITTLAYVEAPQVVVPASAPWASEKEDGDEAPKVTQERAITTSLRKTVRHLYRIGGSTAYFRGLACSLCIAATYFILTMPFAVIMFIPSVEALHSADGDKSLVTRLKHALVPTIIDTALRLLFASWDTAWVHIVITQPTLRIWYRRLPPFFPTLRATWRAIVVAHSADALALNVLPVLLKYMMGLYSPLGVPSPSSVTSDRVLSSLVWLVSSALYISITIPLDVVVVRTQASLLPEEEETIVPFDRSFGTSGTNGLKPGLLAEPRGPLSFREAWQSITRAEFQRIMIVSAKMLALRAVINGAFWPVLGNSVVPAGWVPWRF